MKCFGMLLDGRARKTGIKRRADDKTVLIVMNAFEGAVDYTLPPSEGVQSWSLMIDTNIADLTAVETFKPGDVYLVTGRSLLLFAVNNSS